MNGELFRLAGGFDAVHLPFKGAPEAMTEVIAGRADFYFSPLVNAMPLMQDGQLQALAVSNSKRASALPDVPTVAEAGYPNSEYNFWAGVFVPAKTPAPIKEKLYAEIKKALEVPAVRGKLTKSRRRSDAADVGRVRCPGPQGNRDQQQDRQGRQYQGGVSAAISSRPPRRPPRSTCEARCRRSA